MSDESLRLDGNAAAGLLAEIIPFEMTSAQSECAGCGQVRPLGALMLYGGEMGAVLSPAISGVLRDATGDWTAAVFLDGGLMLVSFVLLCLVREQRRPVAA